MGDRRQGERREPEKGVFRIKKRDFIIGLIIACVIIISLGCNIYLAIRNQGYKNRIDEYIFDSEYDEDEWEAIEDFEEDVEDTEEEIIVTEE